MKPKEMFDSNLANYLSGRRKPAKCTTFESPLTYRGVKPQDAWMPFHWAQVNVHDNQIRVKFFDLFDCCVVVGSNTNICRTRIVDVPKGGRS
jgi:hypothetical protein